MGGADGIAVNVHGFAQLFNRGGDICPPHPGVIGLFHAVGGVHKGVGHVPVVGHYQQTFRVEIQPAHGIKSGTGFAYKLRHVFAALLVG